MTWETAYAAWPAKAELPVTDIRVGYEVAGFKAGYLSQSAKIERLEAANKLLEEQVANLRWERRQPYGGPNV